MTDEFNALRSRLAGAVAEFKAERQAKAERGIAETVRLLESDIDRLRDVDLMTWPEISECLDRIGIATSPKVLANEYARLKKRRARKEGERSSRTRKQVERISAASARAPSESVEPESGGASVTEAAVDIVRCHDGREGPRGKYVRLKENWTITDNKAWWEGQKNRNEAPRVPIEQVDDLCQELQRKKRDRGWS